MTTAAPRQPPIAARPQRPCPQPRPPRARAPAARLRQAQARARAPPATPRAAARPAPPAAQLPARPELPPVRPELPPARPEPPPARPEPPPEGSASTICRTLRATKPFSPRSTSAPTFPTISARYRRRAAACYLGSAGWSFRRGIPTSCWSSAPRKSPMPSSTRSV
ncbi:MAG TPA: hypothetical protein ENK31_08500 [Nannocystis exedens]|nr:hypothetical protein [Nannocystis exedens]